MKNYFAISAFAALVLATGFIGISNMENQEELGTETDIQKFQSEKQFRSFMSSDTDTTNSLGRTTAQFDAAVENTANMAAGSASGGSGAPEVRRKSETNVQVAGIQEPDILKNGGEKIFYSSDSKNNYYNSQDRNASVFNTLPAENFSEIEEIPEKGRMFLTDNSVIFLGDKIASYDRENYQKNWEKELNSSVNSARRINDTIYLVMAEQADGSGPCPVRPMETVTMECTDFYRPSSADAGDKTYTLVKMDAEQGEVEETTGFAGTGSNTVIYMSENSFYITYLTTKSESEVTLDYLKTEGEQHLDQETVERIEEIDSYDISDQSKYLELQRALRDYRESLKDEKSEEVSKNIRNGLENYTEERKRELTTTGIAEFTKDLELEAEGSVPGEVNDQFSISEKDGDLRIATTAGNSWTFNVESENDLYVLDEELERKGQIQGLGLTEEIYSVRYINDKAYIVTFRRVDPFHTVDLSDPTDPELKGELKLPGYSSYLHPLSDDRILGIGEEDGRVKAVVFDVSQDKPEIEESKILEDWYSEISESHHAFKIDREKEIFFLPGSTGGHIFNYTEGIERIKKVDITDAERATYVNDNLYVFNSTHTTAVNQNTWKTVKTEKFANSTEYNIRDPWIAQPTIPR